MECGLKILLQRLVVQSTKFVLLTGRVKSTKSIHQSTSHLRNYKVLEL